MSLRNYILDEKNIYLAIYAVKSYVFDPQLMDKEDTELLNLLIDPFNERIIERTIKEVKKILEKILDEDDYLFKTQVYFKPKDYRKGEIIYRPIHTAELVQLIAMVAMLHPLIYEIPDEKDNWKLNLSNYSRLIPNNFYGNRVSKRPEELFKKWNIQYKKYTQKANDYFRTYHESKEFKYELKLDLKNFFPSVSPMVIYGILVENIPVTLSDDDVEVFKKIIYKLLVCEVTNLNKKVEKEKYYGLPDVKMCLTRGIAQGLPQSYFFGNICMIKVSDIFEKKYPGKAVYYVDDSYIYTNVIIADKEDLKSQLEDVNRELKKMGDRYTKAGIDDIRIANREEYSKHIEMLFQQGKIPYIIEVHTDKKSTFTKIQDVHDGEIYLRTLSREASQIGTDISSTYSEEEDETILHKTQALLESIEKEKQKNEEIEERVGYIEKLERYYKFLKYREIKLRLKIEKNLNKNIFEILVGDTGTGESQEKFDGYKLLEKGIDVETFFEVYKHDIWSAALTILIANTVFEHEKIRNYIWHIIALVYPKDLRTSAFLLKEYKDYLKGIEIDNIPDYYATLNKQINKKMIQYANLNSKALRKEFTYARLMSLEDDILSSYDICSNWFVNICKIVDLNSSRLKRMFLNAVYSRIFKVNLSENVVLGSYDKKGITYGELRLLVFLRNPNCDIQQFLRWAIELTSTDNSQNIDYTIFEVLDAYKRYVKLPEYIDDLIMIHKYTCDVWKNGAKHLYFYTLHNQEHAVDLVKNIIKIMKTFSYFRITNYDYYLLFNACYLHDISMVRIASSNDFLLDTDSSNKIVTKLEEKWLKSHSVEEIRSAIVETYKEVDGFFENKIRSRHAQESAEEIRKRSDLKFLEHSVRENIAEIAESHMMDTKDIYFLKSDAKKRLISHKFNKILLRFADLLDMSQHRVSKLILNHNIDNMSPISAFHWVSHLLTERYELTTEYRDIIGDSSKKKLSPGSIEELVTLSIYIKLSQFSKLEPYGCKYAKIVEDSICKDGFEIQMIDSNSSCNSSKCNFLCRWFNEKNSYLVQEMQALEAYLSRIPTIERFYNTKIRIRVVVSNPTDLSDEQFEILKRKIT